MATTFQDAYFNIVQIDGHELVHACTEMPVMFRMPEALAALQLQLEQLERTLIQNDERRAQADQLRAGIKQVERVLAGENPEVEVRLITRLGILGRAT